MVRWDDKFHRGHRHVGTHDKIDVLERVMDLRANLVTEYLREALCWIQPPGRKAKMVKFKWQRAHRERTMAMLMGSISA